MQKEKYVESQQSNTERTKRCNWTNWQKYYWNEKDNRGEPSGNDDKNWTSGKKNKMSSRTSQKEWSGN